MKDAADDIGKAWPEISSINSVYENAIPIKVYRILNGLLQEQRLMKANIEYLKSRLEYLEGEINV